MRNPELSIIRFAEEDVIATSYYYFSGLGSDKSAENGNGLSITYRGADVTNTYYNEYNIKDNESNGVPITDAENKTSAELNDIGIADGAYTLDAERSKFSPVSRP